MKHAARLVAGCAVALALGFPAVGPTLLSAQSDLDAFMREVLAQRDDNWKKLQQYVLDERERFEIRGPAHTPLIGETRDYTWYIREGFFVRSPLRVNGAPVSENDRREYEQNYLNREKRREEREKGKEAAAPENDRAPAPAPPPSTDAPRDLDSLIRQSRQPQFISSAYFLKFKFDQGRYALVGRETLDGHQVLKIEYYPSRLFEPDQPKPHDNETDAQRRARERDEQGDATLMRLMNKTSKVTLWIEPQSHQILKYVFDDLGWNFFPAPWIVRVSNVSASMTVGEMFPGVFLPRSLQMDFGMLMAAGTVEGRYSLDYHDYRQPDVGVKIGTPGQK